MVKRITMTGEDEEAVARPALYSTVGLSFWGGVDPTSGVVIDLCHPLAGKSVAGAILCLPGGRGSCTGSQAMLELILNGKAPFAIVTRSPDVILCTGAIVAEEFFADEEGEAPIMCAVGDEAFARLVEEGRGALTVARMGAEGDVCIRGGGEAIVAKDLLRLEDTLEVVGADVDADDDPPSPAAEMAMRTVRRVASVSGATELVPVTSAHVDAVTYIGPGGLAFARRLARLGGRVKVR